MFGMSSVGIQSIAIQFVDGAVIYSFIYAFSVIARREICTQANNIQLCNEE
jgi:hypothetical protein